VAAIAGQLVQGNLTAELQKSQGAKAAIIREVFDKVLIGYTVENVILEPGVTTVVRVRLIPWHDKIVKVNTTVNVEGMSPPIEAMVRRDLAGAEEIFSTALENLPLAATDWTNGALKKRMNEFLPEFRADFDIETGETATVALTVYPRLPVIRTVDLSMRSDTLPNLAMLEYRDDFETKTDLLIGVPVDFVRRHQAEIAASLGKSLDDNEIFRRFDVHTIVTLTIAEKSQVLVRSDAEKYRLRLTGWVDIGRQDNEKGAAFRFHLGRRIAKKDEIFVRAELYPQKMNWQSEIGYRRDFGTHTAVNLAYSFSREKFKIGLEQNMGRDWRIRYEYRWGEKKGEAGLGYKLHDFLELEYVIDNKENWLRLIGHF